MWRNTSFTSPTTQGTARRKRKVVHKTATDDKKLQVRMKRDEGRAEKGEGQRERKKTEKGKESCVAFVTGKRRILNCLTQSICVTVLK